LTHNNETQGGEKETFLETEMIEERIIETQGISEVVRPAAIREKNGIRLTEIIAGPRWAGVRKRRTMNGDRLIRRRETKPK